MIKLQREFPRRQTHSNIAGESSKLKKVLWKRARRMSLQCPYCLKRYFDFVLESKGQSQWHKFRLCPLKCYVTLSPRVTYQPGKEHFRTPSHSNFNNCHVLGGEVARLGRESLTSTWSLEHVSCLLTLYCLGQENNLLGFFWAHLPIQLYNYLMEEDYFFFIIFYFIYITLYIHITFHILYPHFSFPSFLSSQRLLPTSHLPKVHSSSLSLQKRAGLQGISNMIYQIAIQLGTFPHTKAGWDNPVGGRVPKAGNRDSP